MKISLIVALSAGFLIAETQAEETEHRFRILSLFQPDRVEDLREVVESLPGITLLNVDFPTAVATFRFDAAQVFPGAKTEEQLVQQLSQKLRGETQGVIEALPLDTIPADQLKEVRIPIIGLDCKGCSYAAYLAVCKIEGVNRATASFRDGVVVAWIDPKKTNRAALEEALTMKRVTLKESADK